MATEADYNLLREKTNTTIAELDNTEAAAIFARTEARYPSNAAAAFAAACVEVLEAIWARATEGADYTQNEESERLSQIAEAKRKLLEYWQSKLDEAVGDAELPKGRRPAFFSVARAGRRWYP
jgi:hypothetical protein